MSDDFETVSVEAEISGLVSAVPAEPVSAPAEETQAYVPEAMPAEIEATQLNLDAGDETLKQNSQQVYNENNGRVSDSAPAITQKGRDEQEAAKEEKKGEFLAVLEQSAKDREKRKELEENFGMTSKDLTKLLNFISNPELQEKLKARLVKNGMSKERAEKTLENMSEFKKLKEKEDSGQKLSDEEKARLIHLRKDQDLKIAVQEVKDMQQMANKRDLETDGATSKAITKEMGDAGAGAEAKVISLQQKASFESFTDSGIKADAITSQYNIAATAANKNEIKTPDIAIAQNNALQVRANDTGMASLTI